MATQYEKLLGDLSTQYEQWVAENNELDKAFREERLMDFVRKHNPRGSVDAGDHDRDADVEG